MTFSQKLEYFLMYYKWVLVLAAGAVLLLIGVRDWIENARRQEILGIMAIDCNSEFVGNASRQIKEELGSTDKYEDVSILPNIHADPESGEVDYQSRMALIAMLQAGEVDVIMMPEKSVETLEDAALFSNLSDVLGDNVTGDAVRLDGNFLVLEKGNPVIEELGFYYEPVYVGMVSYCRNEENAMTWLNILAGNKTGSEQS